MTTARNIYLAIKDNAGAIDKLRGWRIDLALACVDPDQALETTSFTLNGQSAAGQLRGTKADLLVIIGQGLWMVDNDATLSTRTTSVRF